MKRIAALLALILVPALAWAEPATTYFVSASPTVDTNVYATGELVGGKLTFTAALGDYTGTGYINSVRVSDLAAQAVDFDLVLFSKDPTGTTFTDQAAFDIADTDMTKVLAVINLGSSSRFSFADNGVKYIGSLMIPVEGKTSSGGLSRTIYGAFISRGTPTFATSADVTITLGISQDSQ